jgi:micrococcal nuclease
MEPDFANEISGRNNEPLPLGRLERVVLVVAGTLCGVTIAILLLAGAASLCSAAADPLPAPRPPIAVGEATPKSTARAPADAVRVIDGDTIELAGETIRLADVDTPERGARARCDAEARLAELATARLRALLAERPWRIEREKKRDGTPRLDRYRRTMAVLAFVTDGESIGMALVAEGYAVRWAGRRHDWCGRGAR